MPGYFHHQRGGFPLDAVAYVLHPCGEPTLRTLADIRRTLPEDPRHANQPDSYLDEQAAAIFERLSRNFPAAQSAYALVPFRVDIFAGEKRIAQLYYADALRFLRAIGAVSRCGLCKTETHIPDQHPDDQFALCDDCRASGHAYRAQ